MRGSYGGSGVAGDGHATGPGGWPYGGPAGAAGSVPAHPGTLALADARGGRRRRWVLAGTVAALVAVAVAAVLGLHGGTGHASAATGPASAAAAATPSNLSGPALLATERDAALALFAARAAALRTGDLAGWLASVDPDQPALRRTETTLFNNLRQLPLATYSWTFDTKTQVEGFPVPDSVRSVLTGASQVYSPGMTIHYRLRGFDSSAVADEYAPLLLERAGTWYLAGDRTSAATFGLALVEPWTQGAVRVKVTRRSLVVVAAADAARLPALSAQADAAVAAVASMWPRGWSHTAVLYATRSKDVFGSFLGRQLDVSLDDAVTLGVGLPGHARPHDNTRVVLNPQYVVPGYAAIAPILRHEFTHVATWNIEQYATPLWVTEGIAEYTAYRGHLSEQRVSNQVGKDARAHRMAARLPATRTFYGGTAQAQAYHYGVAWLAWQYLSETYGESRLRTLYLRLSTIRQAPDSSAALRAENADFVAVLHVPESSFVRSLNSWIALVLRPV